MDRAYLDEREVFLKEIASLIDRGDYDQARKSALRRCKRYPGDVDAWLVRAACAVNGEQYEEALEILKSLEQVLPGWPCIAEYMGDICRNSGNSQEALAAYRAALEPDGSLRERVMVKAADLAGGGDGEGISPYHHTLALVEAWRREGSRNRAIEIVKSLLEDDPANLKIAGLLKELETERSDALRFVEEELSRWLVRLESGKRSHG